MATKTKVKKVLTAVDIAKDVIRLLDAKLIKSRDDSFSCYVDNTQFSPGSKLHGKSLQRVMRLKSYKPCQVCALGALFMSYVDQENGVTTDQRLNDLDLVYAKLRPFFSDKQLALIETAFEKRVMRNRGSDPSVSGTRESIPYCDDPAGSGYNAAQTAIRFGMQFPTRESRIRGIMNNIIANDGKFRPYDPTPVIYE